jgi:hypothetical protein
MTKTRKPGYYWAKRHSCAGSEIILVRDMMPGEPGKHVQIYRHNEIFPYSFDDFVWISKGPLTLVSGKKEGV